MKSFLVFKRFGLVWAYWVPVLKAESWRSCVSSPLYLTSHIARDTLGSAPRPVHHTTSWATPR